MPGGIQLNVQTYHATWDWPRSLRSGVFLSLRARWDVSRASVWGIGGISAEGDGAHPRKPMNSTTSNSGFQRVCQSGLTAKNCMRMPASATPIAHRLDQLDSGSYGHLRDQVGKAVSVASLRIAAPAANRLRAAVNRGQIREGLVRSIMGPQLLFRWSRCFPGRRCRRP
jgi:hypothetical protein